MVLKIEDKTVNVIPHSIKEFLQDYPSLKSSANQFLLKPVRSVDAKFSLYVGQGEYAIIPGKEDPIKVVGSDDATTCHIIILKHFSGSVAVAHFDGSKNESEAMKNIISEFIYIGGVTDEHDLEAYVVGGYYTPLERQIDKKNDSEKLSLKLLHLFKEQAYCVKICLWCTCESNTKYINGNTYPILNGVAFSRETLEVFPATFNYQLPNYKLRSASHWVSCFQYVVNVYNYNDKSVSIQPFSNWDQDDFRIYASLSDKNILTYFSTSPSAEPPTFCDRLRSVFLLLAQNSPGTLFPNNIPRTYTMSSNGEWKELL